MVGTPNEVNDIMKDEIWKINKREFWIKIKIIEEKEDKLKFKRRQRNLTVKSRKKNNIRFLYVVLNLN